MSSLALLTGALLFSAGPDEDDEYQPALQPASAEALGAMARFELPEGYAVELFAAEPMLAHPVAFCVDHRGRVYVCETFRHHQGVTDIRDHRDWLDDDYACRTVADRVEMLRRREGDSFSRYEAHHERVRRLVDLDGDGVADQATVFADGFRFAADGIGAGLLARGRQVWYTCIPDLWLLEDADDDGRAELRRSLHHGFGVHIGLLGHDLHGLILGPDGRLYFSFGDRGAHVETADGVLDYPDTGAVFRCELDGSGLECFHSGLRNPQELVFDDFGDLFTGDNNSDGGDRARWVHVVEGGDSGWRIGYQWSERHNRRGPWNAERLWLPHFDGQAAYIVPPRMNLTDGPSGLCRHPGTGLGADGRYQGYFFLCDFRGDANRSGVHALRLEPEGASWKPADFHHFAWKVLATDVDFTPDGDVFVSDWIQGWDRTGKGRMYRVAAEAKDPRAEDTAALLAAGFEHREDAALIALLSNPDVRVRMEAQFTLVARDSVGALTVVARAGDSLWARLHAIWGLGQRARTTGFRALVEPLVELLDDPVAEVRAQAAKVLGEARWSAAAGELLEGLRDDSARVQAQCAIALGKLERVGSLGPLCALLAETGESDLVLRHSAVMGLAAVPLKELLGRAADPDRHVRMGALLSLRRRGSEEVRRFLADPEPLLVIEAARAINDAPIEGAMSALADLIDGRVPLLDEGALGLRVLNANDRLGGPAHAARLAVLAADEAAPERLRIEALRILHEWDRPVLRDRVTNAHRPLQARGPVDAAKALAAHPASLRAGASRVREAAARAFGGLGILAQSGTLLAMLKDEGQPAGVRRAALSAVTPMAPEGLPEAVAKALGSTDALLRSDARKVLAELDGEHAFPILRDVIEEGALAERQEALVTLGTMRHEAVSDLLGGLVDRWVAGELPPELELELAEAVAARADARSKARVAALQERRVAADATLGAKLVALHGGDAERGRRVFVEKDEAQCLRCHRVEHHGTGEAGPNLSGLADRVKRRQILQSIVDPNAELTEGYSFVNLFLTDGRLLQGQILEEDESKVTLRPADPDEEVVEILLDEVDLRKKGKSSMPVDLIERLDLRELRDLVEFLATRTEK